MYYLIAAQLALGFLCGWNIAARRWKWIVIFGIGVVLVTVVRIRLDM